MEVVQIIPQERIHPRIVKQIFDVPVPLVVVEILLVIKVIPQVRVSERIVEQIFDVPVSQVVEEIVGVFRFFLSASNNAPLRKSWMFRSLRSWRRSLRLSRCFHRSGCRSSSWSRLSVCPFRKSRRIPLKLCDFSLERILHRTVEETVDVPVPCSGANC